MQTNDRTNRNIRSSMEHDRMVDCGQTAGEGKPRCMDGDGAALQQPRRNVDSRRSWLTDRAGGNVSMHASDAVTVGTVATNEEQIDGVLVVADNGDAQKVLSSTDNASPLNTPVGSRTVRHCSKSGPYRCEPRKPTIVTKTSNDAYECVAAGQRVASAANNSTELEASNPVFTVNPIPGKAVNSETVNGSHVNIPCVLAEQTVDNSVAKFPAPATALANSRPANYVPNAAQRRPTNRVATSRTYYRQINPFGLGAQPEALSSIANHAETKADAGIDSSWDAALLHNSSTGDSESNEQVAESVAAMCRHWVAGAKQRNTAAINRTNTTQRQGLTNVGYHSQQKQQQQQQQQRNTRRTNLPPPLRSQQQAKTFSNARRDVGNRSVDQQRQSSNNSNGSQQQQQQQQQHQICQGAQFLQQPQTQYAQAPSPQPQPQQLIQYTAPQQLQPTQQAMQPCQLVHPLMTTQQAYIPYYPATINTAAAPIQQPIGDQAAQSPQIIYYAIAPNNNQPMSICAGVSAPGPQITSMVPLPPQPQPQMQLQAQIQPQPQIQPQLSQSPPQQQQQQQQQQQISLQEGAPGVLISGPQWISVQPQQIQFVPNAHVVHPTMPQQNIVATEPNRPTTVTRVVNGTTYFYQT